MILPSVLATPAALACPRGQVCCCFFFLHRCRLPVFFRLTTPRQPNRCLPAPRSDSGGTAKAEWRSPGWCGKGTWTSAVTRLVEAKVCRGLFQTFYPCIFHMQFDGYWISAFSSNALRSCHTPQCLKRKSSTLLCRERFIWAGQTDVGSCDPRGVQMTFKSLCDNVCVHQKEMVSFHFTGKTPIA